ncbi:MAG: sulfatase-like hydrolase/transferase [Pirellulaceae bacterium]|nr:sulfatase-like hydrolase/transferase [Pirellulaceae bacterium]
MWKHWIMRLTLAGVQAVMGAWLATGGWLSAIGAEKPNIVFIMADDLGWADVGFHAGSAATPHLDQLAAQNLELQQHYVAPVCSPTRTGLLTGRCWSRFDVTKPVNVRALPWDTLTLPRALKQAGYTTCLTGKWHLGSLTHQGPNHFGFDHAFGSLAGGVSPWNHRYKKGPFTHTWHRNEQLLDQTGHVTDLITNEAIQWLESRDASPFFLYVPFTAVHLPLKEPAEWLAKVPNSIQGDVARHYAASVMHLDDSVGKILSTLQRLGRRDNTLIVYTSDNGGSTAENNDLSYPDDNCPNGKLPGNNRPWRGQKGQLYEGGTRVPTIVAWPGHVRPGQVDSPVQIIDWFPTFAALAGFKPSTDPNWDGIDLTELLTAHTPPATRPLYAVAPQWQARSVRMGDWKLIVGGSKTSNNNELYNLASDPQESNNLAEAEPDRLQALLKVMADISRADKDSVVVE